MLAFSNAFKMADLIEWFTIEWEKVNSIISIIKKPGISQELAPQVYDRYHSIQEPFESLSQNAISLLYPLIICIKAALYQGTSGPSIEFELQVTGLVRVDRNLFMPYCSD